MKTTQDSTYMAVCEAQSAAHRAAREAITAATLARYREYKIRLVSSWQAWTETQREVSNAYGTGTATRDALDAALRELFVTGEYVYSDDDGN